MMLKIIFYISINVKWTEDQLEFIIPGYKTATKEGIFQILNGELVFYKPILENSPIRCIGPCSIISEKECLQIFPFRGHWRAYGGIENPLQDAATILLSYIKRKHKSVVKRLYALYIIQRLQKQEARITFFLISHHPILYYKYRHMVTRSITE